MTCQHLKLRPEDPTIYRPFPSYREGWRPYICECGESVMVRDGVVRARTTEEGK